MTTLHNFADYNTISVKSSNIETLLKVLEKNSNIAIEWFLSLRNEMIVKPEKIQAIIIKRDNHTDQEYILHLKNQKVTKKENVKLLGIDIDNKLKFDYHISKICSKARNQLHRSEEHTSELQSLTNLVCRLLLEKKKKHH